MREEQKPLLNIEIRDLFYKDLCGRELWNNRRVTPAGRRNNLWQHSASSCRCWNKGLVTGKIQHRENQTPKRVLICAKELPSWQKKRERRESGWKTWLEKLCSFTPPSQQIAWKRITHSGASFLLSPRVTHWAIHSSTSFEEISYSEQAGCGNKGSASDS